MKKILVVGANGQLGHCLQKIASDYHFTYQFNFANSATVDVTNLEQIETVFQELQPDFCINASAYTAVDLAETETEKAFAVNAYGVGNLAQVSADNNCTFIHVSTDYVFEGNTNIDYSEDNFTSPIGVYGSSKLKGEELALENNPQTIILRTSWLYSEFNKNFVKTMLNLFNIKEEMGIVNDQYGQPTNCNDLAEAIMTIIDHPKKDYGVFHFSNYPETTWFKFAEEIKNLSNSTVKLNPITTDQFPTPAKRPVRSTMNLDKIEATYGISPKRWEHSLENCITILKNAE